MNRIPLRSFACLLVALAASIAGAVDPMSGPVDDPGGVARIGGLAVPSGVRVKLIASSPQFRSPVAICVDEKNRIYLAEAHRFNRGTEENRNRTFLLDDDLRNQTIEDRLRSYQREVERFGGSMDYFTRYSDRVMRLEDTDHDGRIDRSTVFADNFRDPLSGLGSGLIARQGSVWYTNIPDVWRLKDTNDDGVADSRRSIVRGFGVQNAFLGHDLHGLAWGPDGKLYFSVGDRGYHVETDEGEVFHGPRNGAVFRCNPDGTNFEVVHNGLRNPQELAFDDEGNLFTADNNCDKGDHSRLVNILEGGCSGWNMAYQTLTEPYLTGPWHAEGYWNVPPAYRAEGINPAGLQNARYQIPVQKKNPLPAWIVPPVGAVGSGPSGFTCHPGGGPLSQFSGRLMMCNYTGGGGLEAFTIEPRGAGFLLTQIEDVCKPISATDVEFTFDGRVLLSDFVSLHWDGSSGGGRLYSLTDDIGAEVGKKLAELSAKSFDELPAAELAGLLSHEDRRIRQRAQFSLADRKAEGAAALVKVLQAENSPKLARLHALWGIGQIGNIRDDASWAAVRLAMTNNDPSIRGQACRVCGWAGFGGDALLARLKDENPRVQLLAAEALGKVGDRRVTGALFTLLATNADRDPLLRHAACYALYRLNATDAAVERCHADSAAERLGAVLVLRHASDSRVAQFLADEDSRIVTEAARAINDLPLDSAMGDLARWTPPQGAKPGDWPEALWRRVINACFRQGDAQFARRVADIAANNELTPMVREEALAALKDWTRPGDRDRVTGFWRPLAPRNPQAFRFSVAAQLAKLPQQTPPPLRAAAIDLLTAYRIPIYADDLATWFGGDQPASVRAAACRLAAASPRGNSASLLKAATNDKEPQVRIAARESLAKLEPESAVESLSAVVNGKSPTTAEQQAAIQMLGAWGSNAADAPLRTGMEKLLVGEWPAETTLDLLTAARRRPAVSPLATQFDTSRANLPLVEQLDYTLVGGSAERGRTIFFNHVQAQCVRCHQINLDGGIAGPKLNGVATRHAKKGPGFFLQSIVEPSAEFAKGYEQVMLVIDDGRVAAGSVQEETPTELVLREGDGKLLRFSKDSIEERRTGQSPMPSMRESLSPYEIRDLISFLQTLK